ncbi:MAG TPA: adenylyl-sulfate kinase [Caldilineaceae bacterium]|nr:adenylyl-sulfate kinase [Caldilineaceae bacterium]
MSAPAQSSALPQTGWAIWLTGLPASGKTTIARHLQQRLSARRISAVVLDSDALRPVLAPTAGYDEAGRDDFYARLVGLAELLVVQGVPVIIAATANRRAHRDAARRRLPRFAEVWVKCSLEVCRRRDPKGLYARALAGEIENLPGVQVAYEEPLTPDLILDSDHQTPEEAADALLASLPFFQQT